MYKDILVNIAGIANYPVFSFIVFGLFFVALVTYVVKADKKLLAHMENLPIQQSHEPNE